MHCSPDLLRAHWGNEQKNMGFTKLLTPVWRKQNSFCGVILIRHPVDDAKVKDAAVKVMELLLM